MNFSPYSPSPDEDRTSRSPKKHQKHQQPSSQAAAAAAGYSSYQAGSDSYAEQGLLGSGNGAGSSSSSSAFNGQQAIRVNKYETSLPIRVDVEASLAYVLGPVTGMNCCIGLLGNRDDELTNGTQSRIAIADSRETERLC